jgi:hypothetical protein
MESSLVPFTNTLGPGFGVVYLMSALVLCCFGSCRVVVVLEYKIYVYNFADLKLIDHIETAANPKGLCCVRANN